MLALLACRRAATPSVPGRRAQVLATGQSVRLEAINMSGGSKGRKSCHYGREPGCGKSA